MTTELQELYNQASALRSAKAEGSITPERLGDIIEKVIAAVDKAAQLPNYAGFVMRGITIYSDRISYCPDSSAGNAPETAVPAVATHMGGGGKFCIGLYDYGTGIFYENDHNGNQFFMTNNALILHTNKEVYFLKEDHSTPNSYYLYGLGGAKVTIDGGNADVYLPQP